VSGSTDFPVGNTDALRRTRSEFVVKACAEALISMNIGWTLDLSRTNDSSTTSDFANVPCITGSNTYPALFLVNSISGCKLFIAYFGGVQTTDHCMKNFSGNDLFQMSSTSYTNTIAGLCVSMIPDGSTSTFGQTFDSSFLPADATRIIGTARYYTTSSNGITLCNNPDSGKYISWGIWANEYVFAASAAYGSSDYWTLKTPSYAVGKLISLLAHEEDNSVNSRYMTLAFRDSTTNSEGSESEDASVINSTITKHAGNSDTNVLGVATSAFKTGASYVMGAISRTDGTWINGTDSSTYNVILMPLGVEQTSTYVYNASSGKSRWIPFQVMVTSSNLSTYGVVSGDGFKGIIDPDIIMYAFTNNGSNISYGQLLNNGKMMCIDPTYNLLLGWDASNTDSPVVS
jgi:hypothetical protein